MHVGLDMSLSVAYDVRMLSMTHISPAFTIRRASTKLRG